MTKRFQCPDCNEFHATASGVLCEACHQWRKQWTADMAIEYQSQQERRVRRRMIPGARFAEALADMVKAVADVKRSKS